MEVKKDTEGLGVVKYDVTDLAITKMKTDFMALTVKDLDDEAGCTQVHEARMVVKNHRVAVEKKRKDLKAGALEWGRKVDSEAKRITALLEPIETHLQTEEDKVTKEKERIKAEKVRIETERVEGILAKIDDIREKGTPHFLFGKTTAQIADVMAFMIGIGNASYKEYEEFEKDALEAYETAFKAISEASQKRIEFEEEEKSRKAEADRLAKQKKEQDDAQAKITEENLKIQEEKDRLWRDKKAEQDRKEREAFEKKALEEAEKKAKEQVVKDLKAAEEELIRKESLRPDQEKFFSYILSLQSIPEPEIKDPTLVKTMAAFQELFHEVCEETKREIETL